MINVQGYTEVETLCGGWL